MVQMGSRLTRCHGCGAHAVCGSFWFLARLVEVFLCAACLTAGATAVNQAAATLEARKS